MLYQVKECVSKSRLPQAQKEMVQGEVGRNPVGRYLNQMQSKVDQQQNRTRTRCKGQNWLPKNLIQFFFLPTHMVSVTRRKFSLG